MTHLAMREILLFFLLCLKSFCYFGDRKFQKLFFEGDGFVRKFELSNLPHQVSLL